MECHDRRRVMHGAWRSHLVRTLTARTPEAYQQFIVSVHGLSHSRHGKVAERSIIATSSICFLTVEMRRRAAGVLFKGLPYHQGLGKHSLAPLVDEKPRVALFFQRRFVQIMEQAPALQGGGALRRRWGKHIMSMRGYICRTCTHTCSMVDRDPFCKHALVSAPCPTNTTSTDALRGCIMRPANF